MTAYDLPARATASTEIQNEVPVQPSPPIDYLETEDGNWAAAVDNTLQWESSGPYRYVKHGDCPVCGHQIAIRYEEEIVLGFKAAVEVSAPTRMDARCNCPEAHPTMTAGAGCGRSGRIRLP